MSFVHAVFCSCSVQVKYGEEGRKMASRSLYSLLPETGEMVLAKQHSEVQSEVNTFAKGFHSCI